jgi:hypothetical protein
MDLLSVTLLIIFTSVIHLYVLVFSASRLFLFLGNKFDKQWTTEKLLQDSRTKSHLQTATCIAGDFIMFPAGTSCYA